jgi:hypothetical protein
VSVHCPFIPVLSGFARDSLGDLHRLQVRPLGHVVDIDQHAVAHHLCRFQSFLDHDLFIMSLSCQAAVFRAQFFIQNEFYGASL